MANLSVMANLPVTANLAGLRILPLKARFRPRPGAPQSFGSAPQRKSARNNSSFVCPRKVFQPGV